MLIAGCSHTAGSEIDGNLDSVYNRQQSYGNLLAEKLSYKPINIAIGGNTNGAIVRNILDWFNNHDITDKELFVLVGWTESTRIDAPFQYPTWHKDNGGKHADWISPASDNFLHINVAYNNYNQREKEIQNDYKTMLVKHTEFFEVYCANLVLQLQFFFKHLNIKYLMVNTMHMFSPENKKYLQCYLNLIDYNSYIDALNNDRSFFNKYKHSFPNKFKYSHLGPEPHKLYAEEIYKFVNLKLEQKQLDDRQIYEQN